MKATPARAVPVIFSTEVLPTDTAVGAKRFTTVGGDSTTRVALLDAAVPPLVVATVPLLTVKLPLALCGPLLTALTAYDALPGVAHLAIDRRAAWRANRFKLATPLRRVETALKTRPRRI